MDRARPRLPRLQSRTRIRERVGAGVEVMPVVKNDAYGHGLVPITAHLVGEGIRWVMVAKLLEAERLRAAGVECEVLVMDVLFTDATVRSRRRAGADNGGVHRGGGASRSMRRDAAEGSYRAGVREGRYRVATGGCAPRPRARSHRTHRAHAERARIAGVFSSFMQTSGPRPRDAGAIRVGVRGGRTARRRYTVPHHRQHQLHPP